MVESTCFKSPIGYLSILAIHQGVIKISFKNESMEEMEQWCFRYLDMGIIKGLILPFMPEVRFYTICTVKHDL